MQEPNTAPAVDDMEVEESGPMTEPVHTPPAHPIAADAVDDPDDAFSDPGDEDPEPVEVEAPPQTKPDRRSPQARIDKAVAAQRAAERERDEFRARLEALERQAQPRAETPKQEPRYTRPKPSENEIGSKYADYPAYVEDLTDWKLEQRDAAQAIKDREANEYRVHDAQSSAFASKIDKAEQANPGFWSRISQNVANLFPSSSLSARQRAQISEAARQGDTRARATIAQCRLADEIFGSEYATDLMTHLSDNDKEFQRLLTLPPAHLPKEMGRLEARFIGTPAAPSGPAATPSISKAPAPIKPVGTTANAATGKDPLTDDLDIDEHIRVMNARDKKGRFTPR